MPLRDQKLTVQNLPHIVTIQTKTVTRNDYGEEVETWGTEATRRARVQPLSSREFLLGQQTAGETTHEVTLRYHAGLTAEKRLLWGTKVLYLTGPPLVYPEGKPQWMVLMCKEQEGDVR